MKKIDGVRRTVSSSRCISMAVSGTNEFANTGCSLSVAAGAIVSSVNCSLFSSIA